MKAQYMLTALCCVIGMAACSRQEAPEKPGVSLSIENSLPLVRTDEPVVLRRDFIESHLDKIGEDDTLVIRVDKQIVPSQLDDIDGDGTWDELAFVMDFLSEETKTVHLFQQSGDAPAFAARTNIRFAEKTPDGYNEFDRESRPSDYSFENRSKHYQMEGPGWENDNVGFRNYFDERNGLDIFGKKTSEMVLDTAGVDENYHQMQDWGMDILKVGTSLGAGGIAVAHGEKIIRLGKTREKHFNIITEGPVRSIFTLTYQGWSIDGRSIDLVHRITIWAGQHFYHSDVRIEGAWVPEHLLVGIVNFKSQELIALDSGTDKLVFATHAAQGEMDEIVGMAIMTDESVYKRSFEAPADGVDVTDSYLLELGLPDGPTPLAFRFYGVWTPRHTTLVGRQNFLSMLRADAQRWANPVQIRGPGR